MTEFSASTGWKLYAGQAARVKGALAAVSSGWVWTGAEVLELEAPPDEAEALPSAGVPQAASSFILEHFNSPVMILLVINLFLLIVGMVMDTTPAILILTPILLPIVTAINMDPVQFGVIMVVNLAIGFVTPPIGVNLFVASSLTDVPIMAIAKKAMPMIGLFLVALLLITFIPALSLGLL